MQRGLLLTFALAMMLPTVAGQDYAAMIQDAVGEQCDPVRRAIQERVDPVVKRQAQEINDLAADQARRLQEFQAAGVHTIEETTTFQVGLELELRDLERRQRDQRETLMRQLQVEFAGRCAALDEAAKRIPATLPVAADPCEGREVEVAVTRELQRADAQDRLAALGQEFASARARFAEGDDSLGFANEWRDRANDLSAAFNAQSAAAFEAKGLTACFQHQGWGKAPLPQWPERAQRLDVDAHHARPDGLGDFDFAWKGQARVLEAEGQRLSLKIRPDLQRAESISIDGIALFTSIAPDAYLSAIQATAAHGGRLLATDEAGEAWLDANDGERAALRLHAPAGTNGLELLLAPDVKANQAGDAYDLAADGVNARLIVHDGAHALQQGRLTLAGGATLLTFDPDSELPWEDALANDGLGAEIRLADADGDVAADIFALGDLELTVERPRATSIILNVGSNDEEGRTLAFLIAPGLFGRPDLLVLADDVLANDRTRPLAVVAAQSLEDVLDATDDGEAVEYWMEATEDGTQLLVSIPHFSEKRITISAVLPPMVDLPELPAAGLVAALGALAAPALVRRRRL